MVGHKVSHSNRKTKKRFHPNLVTKTVFYDKLGVYIKLKISTAQWRTMAKLGVSSVIEKSLKEGYIAD